MLLHVNYKIDYVLMNFKSTNRLGSANSDNIKIRRLELADDYISFILFNSNDGLSIHYSFKGGR